MTAELRNLIATYCGDNAANVKLMMTELGPNFAVPDAQSQAAGHGFANFWMHNGMVTYEGEKMSKSIGNTVSPTEMLEIAPPRVVRYYLGQAQYRSVLDYQPTSLQEAAAAVERIDGFLSRASRVLPDPGPDALLSAGRKKES